MHEPETTLRLEAPGGVVEVRQDARRQPAEAGHLLACSTGPLRLRVEALTEFRLALPENESFLKADLRTTATDELAYAEQAH